MTTYAIVPARSGSKGVPNKNIRKLCGHELIGYSIAFAKKLGVDRVFCSTDSEAYAEIAHRFGAEVPFLRSPFASGDKAMEQDILKDMYAQFPSANIGVPDLLVWLRPTFVFRDLASVRECITRLEQDSALTACRVVVPSESRLYKIEAGKLHPTFRTDGKSMIRRQDVGHAYRVFCTDVFRGGVSHDAFLGENVGAVVGDKVCGLDIDDEFDYKIVEAVMTSLHAELKDYIHLPTQT